jgi:RimJ/RimL family protein N-acetyltransferase
MRLVDVHSEPQAVDVLWQLLSERSPEVNISHRAMPTPAEHAAFIASRPYAHWYLIDVGSFAGAVYLSKQREIGVGVLKRYRGQHYGRNAVLMLMEKHPGRFLANINPRNEDSLRMFQGLGFFQLQVTYALDPVHRC